MYIFKKVNWPVYCVFSYIGALELEYRMNERTFIIQLSKILRLQKKLIPSEQLSFAQNPVRGAQTSL